MNGQKTTARVENREQQILDVASRHLNTMGVSVEWFGEIAAELGLTRPAIYKYFADREDLLFRCYADACDVMGARLDAAISSTSDSAQALAMFLSNADASSPEPAVLSEMMALPLDKRDLIWRRQQAIIDRISGLIEAGVAAKVFRPIDLAVTSQAVLGLVSWAPIYRRWAPAADLELIAIGSREVLFHGLAANKAIATEKLERLVPLAPPHADVFNRHAVDAAKREGILVAASLLFNQRGIGATRMEDVSAAVGLSKRAIYHHIGQKQDLIDACVERAYAYFLGVMDAAERSEASRLEVVYAAVRDITWAASEPAVCVLAPHVGFGLLSVGERQAAVDYGQQLADGYRRVLTRGVAEGSLRPVPIDAIIASLPGVFSWAANGPEQTPAARIHIADELAMLVTHGLCVDRPEP